MFYFSEPLIILRFAFFIHLYLNLLIFSLASILKHLTTIKKLFKFIFQ